MLWIVIAIALLISAAAAAAVVWPILNSKPAPIIVENDELTDLLYRKDATLNAIKELEFDYHVGKFSQEDYTRYDERLRRQAIVLIEKIEKLAPESANLDTDLEREIARHRQVHEESKVTTAQPDQDGRAGSAPVPVQAKGVALPSTAGTVARFCTNCGNAVEAHHKFCAICGTPMAAQMAVVDEKQ